MCIYKCKELEGVAPKTCMEKEKVKDSTAFSSCSSPNGQSNYVIACRSTRYNFFFFFFEKDA